MCKVTRIVTAALTAAVLTLLAAMPLVAAWRMPADQRAVPVSITPLELMQQTTDSPGQTNRSRTFRWSTDAAVTAASAKHCRDLAQPLTARE
jgi:hypothetical protein